MDGIYLITFRGAADFGSGLLLLRQGQITGADLGGVLYDGEYKETPEGISINAKMHVPPGAALVQGTPARATAYDIPMNMVLPSAALSSGTPIQLNLPPGPVNVIFRKLRDIAE